jgi:uncharacterized protein (DUF1778 family)
MKKRPTLDELAAEFEKRMAEGRELEGLVPVKARVAKPVRHVYSVRMSGKELTDISKAAEARGMTTSDFMRKAALAAVEGQLDLEAGEHRSAIMAVREKARELYEAVEKLEEPR